MDTRDLLPSGPALGVARLALVTAALVGFLAMHGLDMTDGAGSHHAAAVAVIDHGAEDRHSTVVATGSELAPVPDDLPHESVMAGCLFALLALTGGVALRVLRILRDRGASSGAVSSVLPGSPARAPPCPVFVSLCVFRL